MLSETQHADGEAIHGLFGILQEKTFHSANSLPCLQTRRSQNPEPYHPGTGRYMRSNREGTTSLLSVFTEVLWAHS